MQYFMNGEQYNVDIENGKVKLSAVLACYSHYKRTSNYDQAIAFFMMRIIDGEYNSTDEISVSSETINKFIDDYISTHPSVSEKWDELDSNSPKNERFFKAVTQGAEQLDSSFQDLVESIVQPCREGLAQILSGFADYIRQSFDFNQIAVNISKTIASALPSKEERERIVAALQQWGNYGWCLIDWASIDLYHNSPNSVEDADRLAMEYCTEEEISNLIEELTGKIDNRHEFEEAIVSYNNQCYTACSMILFSIVDSFILRLQDYKDTPNRKEWRMLPGKYVEELKRTTDEKSFLREASYIAMLNAIASMYKGGNDFTNESQDMINRNFVDHGMNTRRVTQIDCIKLFLIIDDLFYFLKENGWSFKSDKYTEKHYDE